MDEGVDVDFVLLLGSSSTSSAAGAESADVGELLVCKQLA